MRQRINSLTVNAGFCAACRRDVGLCWTHHPNAIQDEEENLPFHIGKSTDSETTIWLKGIVMLKRVVTIAHHVS